MGCGQSKINIYPRRSKGKNNAKKAAVDKTDGEEDESGEKEHDSNANDDTDSKRKLVKSKNLGHVGGPLLIQAELSSSQQNFFRMLDEKIENGPDYDSEDETEMALESARLHALLKDWETASAGSRSLPATPKHQPRRVQQQHPYGVGGYRHQTNYNPTYQTHSPTHQYYVPVNKVPQGIHYQDYAAVYAQNYTQNYAQATFTHPNAVVSSPVHSPKHKYQGYQQQSPHKMYVTPQQGYTNGEYLLQQQLYSQQMQYQQSREYQQYRQGRDQLLLQQAMGVAYVQAAPSGSQRSSHNSQHSGHYQSSVHVPVGVGATQDGSPHHTRSQRHYESEMT